MTETDIKYVYVEMINNKGAKQDVVTGLFGGVFKYESETYILLHGKKDCMSVLNVKCYDIMTIEMLEPEFKNMTIATMERGDQEDIRKLLDSYYDKLIAAGYTPKPGSQVIDITKYTNVPEGYFQGRPAGESIGQVGTHAATGAGDFAANRNRYTKNQNGNYAQTVVKPDPVPVLLERSKTKKPTKDILMLLAEKIENIKSGAVAPTIPELIGEVEADASAPTTSTDEEFERDVYGYGGMY